MRLRSELQDTTLWYLDVSNHDTIAVSAQSATEGRRDLLGKHFAERNCSKHERVKEAMQEVAAARRGTMLTGEGLISEHDDVLTSNDSRRREQQTLVLCWSENKDTQKGS